MTQISLFNTSRTICLCKTYNLPYSLPEQVYREKKNLTMLKKISKAKTGYTLFEGVRVTV